MTVRAPQNRILVIRGGALGDFVLTLPVLSALRSMFPTAPLEVLGYPRIASLALDGGLAERVRSLEERPLALFFARRATLDEEWASWFGEFAVVVSYLYDPDCLFRDNVMRSCRGQFIQGPHRPDDALGKHAADVLLEPLQRLAIFGADPVPALPLEAPGKGRSRARDVDAVSPAVADLFAWVESHRPIALHPGSGSERKNWPEAMWRQLVQQLMSQTSQRLLLVGGEAEGDRLQRLADGLPAARVRLAIKLPLPEVARLLSRSRHLLGHDSGISHLAAAVGTPVSALWGDTSEAVWRPRGGNVSIVRDPAGLHGMGCHRVWGHLIEAGLTLG